MIAMDGQIHLMLRSAVRRFNDLKSFLVSTRTESVLYVERLRIKWTVASNKENEEMKFNVTPTHSVG